ncbi:hypothetical protein [Jeotgalicoccus sp. WY2]|uniref:hypothetical protein n=1 Tax=Jeotgalicoccus sp. WY2 TaxID=2708346 RepID=UPI001BD20229|nr:hypothetical protein [Jeotgalicoccus sp. WY2]
MKRILTLVSMILALLFVSSNAVSAEENTYDRVYMITVDRFLNNNSGNDVGVTPDGDPYYPFGGDFNGIVLLFLNILRIWDLIRLCCLR